MCRAVVDALRSAHSMFNRSSKGTSGPRDRVQQGEASHCTDWH